MINSFGEGDGGGGCVIAGRITVMEKMSVVPDRCGQVAGLTLDAILANEKPLMSSPDPTRRTLLDIIRDEDPDSKIFGRKDRKSWKLFRDGLRIKRAAAAWTSLAGEWKTLLKDSVPTKDRGPRPQSTRRRSSSSIVSSSSDHECSSSCGGGVGSLHMSSSSSSSSPSSTTQFSRHNSIRVANVAREGTYRLAVAALAQAEQAVAPMELLEETDRQTSVRGPRRSILSEYGDEEEYKDCEEEEEEEEEEYEECEEEEENVEGEMEKKCCVCMVRHIGAAFIPCGHTFCRLCSRELWAKRRNCPLCNASISEILYIF